MGNCCAVESSMEWAGEDWGSYSSKHKGKMGSSKVFDEVHGLSFENVEKERLLLGSLRRASSDHVNGKVKIKISKKELAELLGGKEKKQVVAGHATAEQVLVRLINARYHVNEHHDAHHRSWKPVLQGIPEVN
ncbi:uncharacterized protein LOC133293327 [Gastrolobium bilobum]|uniref:uncharacterized protein LOC133293327 n=1 Tax=Gastrolobium bilobum TaxID=150636 RepID=UPI002AB2F675|nr:uncharacterized protein LOC133293327 [Gastrolobium bilobum]